VAVAQLGYVRRQHSKIMIPDPYKEKLEAHKRMVDTLVKLGYAKIAVLNETTGMGGISWTGEGLVFREQLLKAYDHLAKGKGKDGMSEFVTLLTFIITKYRSELVSKFPPQV